MVSDNKVGALPRSEALSTRVRRLQAEAKGLAREHIAALVAALHEAEALSAEIAEGGEAYPPASATSRDAWPRRSRARWPPSRRSTRGTSGLQGLWPASCTVALQPSRFGATAMVSRVARTRPRLVAEAPR
uniref:Uncharacterized protein n=1 Tax=Phenylobacterium glaciei TaxID=2803784 RepID=A0A974S9F3_9CAUL|nr:hypothetical protein JKL49_21515 [Phenylobacterium glaciei]